MGDTLYPQVCEERRALFCEIENLLYLLGGPPLAAAPSVVLAAWLLWVSLRALWRRLTATRF